jgi:uncharacterized protein YndB with AHSA1/START domain
MRLRFLAAAVAAGVPFAAQAAEVVQVSPTGFTLRHEVQVNASVQQAYKALGRVDRWWNKSHTYSGNARNLSLELKANGCFCEKWPGGTVAHGRVLMAMPGQVLRLDAPLGPLQAMPVAAILDITLKPEGDGARVTMTYSVSGPLGPQPDKLAAVVLKVLTEQMTGLQSVLR